METVTFPSSHPTPPQPQVAAPRSGADRNGPDASGDGTMRSRGRLGRLVRGPEQDPPWARPAYLVLLLATAGAYLWNLTSAGWANAFYSAAAQAGAESWAALFWGSFDMGNAITVDKPPAALWVMALSVRVFGLSSFAILLPQVLRGVGTVAVVHATVRRWFGHGAALLAGAVMALTPVAVLMFRFNNPDALLTLLMALAVWATLRAVAAGSIRWMVLAGVFTGLGFLTKGLQVFLVLPALGLVWLVCADTTVRRRLLGGLAALGALVASAGWWVAVVELVPSSMRPYIGGSQTDSFLELTFGYNGLGRLDGTEVGSVGNRGPNSGTGSLWRMFGESVGGQISWLLPTALLLLVAGLWFRGRAARTDLRRAAYLVMGGWLVVTVLTFSLMQGIFHEYYTVALAPAIAALVGMGGGEAWERRGRASGLVVLSAATATTAVWASVLLSRTPSYAGWLRFGVLGLGLTTAALFLVADRLGARTLALVAAGAVVAGLAGPAAYSATTVTTAHSGSIVAAGPSTGAGPGGNRVGAPGAGGPAGVPGGQAPAGGTVPGGPPPGGPPPGGAPGGGTAGGMGGLLDASTPGAAVVEALQSDAGSYTWVAAAVGSQNAAGLQLASKEPVMAIGGFNGSDPSPRLAQFQQYVASGQIHYFLAGGGFRGQNGGSDAAGEIATWVQTTFTEVTIGGETFYDLTQPLSGSADGGAAS